MLSHWPRNQFTAALGLLPQFELITILALDPVGIELQSAQAEVGVVGVGDDRIILRYI